MVQFKVSRPFLNELFKLAAIDGQVVGATFGEDVVTFDVDCPRAPAETVEMRPVYRGTGPHDVVLQSVEWVGPDGASTVEDIA